MPAQEGGVANIPVGVEVDEGVAACQNQVGEGQPIEKQQRQRDQRQRSEIDPFEASQRIIS